MPSRFTKERFPSGCSTGLWYFFPVRNLETVSRNIGSTTRLGMKLAYWLAGTSRTGLGKQARNQDFMWGGANEAKADPTTEMYFLSSDPFI